MKTNLKSVVAIVALLGMMLLVLTGCGENTQPAVELDMAKVNENLANLKGDKFDLFTAESDVTMSGVANFDSLTMLYDFDFKNFGINPDNITEYRFNINETTKDLWIVFLPVEGMKDTVKSETDAYLQKLIADETDAAVKTKLQNYSYEEVNGYLVWVVSADNNKIMELTKNAKAAVLPMMMEVTVDTFQDVLSLDPSTVSEYAIKQPAMITSSTTYMVVKPAEGKKAEVKAALDNYMVALENQWATYLPDQYELVKNRMYKEYGDYLIYIVSSDNDAIYNTIIGSTK